MPAVQAAQAARQRSQEVERRASQRRRVVQGTVVSRRDDNPPMRRSSPRSPVRKPRRTPRGSVRAAGRVGGEYLPTSVGSEAGSAVGALEAEFIGAVALLFLTIFTDVQSSYSDKILAVMKRGTLLAITFFILALVSGMGPNAARGAKAFGALVDVAVIMSIANSEVLGELDNFFKGNWTGTGESGASASSGAAASSGNSILGGSALGAAAKAIANAYSKAIGAIAPIFNTGGLSAAEQAAAAATAARSPTGTVGGSRL